MYYILLFTLFFLGFKNCTQNKETIKVVKVENTVKITNLKQRNKVLIDSIELLKKSLKNNHLIKWNNRIVIKKVPYINTIEKCNDTLNKVITINVENDTLCQKIISKQTEIIKKDSVLIKNKDTLILVKEKIALNLNSKLKETNKQVRNEKRKKVFWKFATATAIFLSIFY